MSLNELNAAYYAQSDLEKQAQVELFAKLAAENGIDLDALSQDQIDYLWGETFKTAAEEEKKDEKDEDKVEEAKKEHEEKKAAAAKLAEADYIGRVMAHAMTDELNKIAAATSLDKEAAGTAEMGARARGLAAAAKDKLKSVGGALKDVATAREFREGRQATKNLESSLGKSMAARAAMENAPKGQREEFAKKLLSGYGAEAKDKTLRGAAKTVGLYGGAAAAAGGAAALHHKEKKSSALDELAAEMAVVKAASAGWDLGEASERVAAVLTLGMGDSEKVASVADLESAVEVRSLEFLEAAGYPVTWNG